MQSIDDGNEIIYIIIIASLAGDRRLALIFSKIKTKVANTFTVTLGQSTVFVSVLHKHQIQIILQLTLYHKINGNDSS